MSSLEGKVVIKLLQSEGETALNISRRLKRVYCDNAVDCSTVTRWVKRINDKQEKPGANNLCGRSRSGSHLLLTVNKYGAFLEWEIEGREIE